MPPRDFAGAATLPFSIPVHPSFRRTPVNKLKLRLDDLLVDTFQTTSAAKEKGTVFGEQCTCYTNCTCPGCPTCDYTCGQSCGGSCEYSCNGSCVETCHNSCANDSCLGSCGLDSCYYSCPQGMTCYGAIC
jgi:hypothetical protein